MVHHRTIEGARSPTEWWGAARVSAKCSCGSSACHLHLLMPTLEEPANQGSRTKMHRRVVAPLRPASRLGLSCSLRPFRNQCTQCLARAGGGGSRAGGGGRRGDALEPEGPAKLEPEAGREAEEGAGRSGAPACL